MDSIQVITDGILFPVSDFGNNKIDKQISNKITGSISSSNLVIETNPNELMTFIPDNQVITIKKNNLVLHNGVYKKYQATGTFSGELIICSDKRLSDSFVNYELQQETYEEYLKIKSERNKEKDQWIYNIIDGKDEQDRIIYENSDIILIPNYNWDGKFVKADGSEIEPNPIKLLVIFKDKNLSTIRDLSSSDIELLKRTKCLVENIITNDYSIPKSKLKMFFHYAPTTFQLHLHITSIYNLDVKSSCEYSHELHNIIFNLELCGDYYKKINMLTRKHN